MSVHASERTPKRRPLPMPRGVPVPRRSPTRPPSTTNDADAHVLSCSLYDCQLSSFSGRALVSHEWEASVRPFHK